MLAAASAAITARMSFRDSLHALLFEGDAVWAFLSALVLVLCLTPLAARLAPRTEERDRDRPRVHSGFIPRTGGVAIVAAILVPAALFLDLEGAYLGILLGTLGVAALGLVDDIHGLRPSVKLAGVALIAADPGRRLRRHVRPDHAAASSATTTSASPATRSRSSGSSCSRTSST